MIAPDSFKGSASAAAVADALSAGWCSVRPDDEIVLLPMADGGEGTLDAFAGAVPGARRMPVTVTGPDGAPVEVSWLLLPGDSADAASAGIAVVELASTCGIELLGERLRPLDASTRGLGEAIAAALRAYQEQRLGLPEGCEVTYELQAIDILRALLRSGPEPADRFRAQFVRYSGQRSAATRRAACSAR